MKQQKQSEHPLRLGIIAVTFTLLYIVILLPLGTLKGAQMRSYDQYLQLRNELTSPPPEVNDFLLVQIDDTSQRELNRKWPWPRSIFADFLEKIDQHNPKVIHMDLVLAGDSDPENDQQLAAAIKATQAPILLAAFLDAKGDPVLPNPIFTDAGGTIGMINKPRDKDHVVRRMWSFMRMPLQSKPLYAIELKTAAIALGESLEGWKITPEQLLMDTKSFPIEPPGVMHINYLARRDQLPTVSFWQVLNGELPPEMIQDKIVMLGTSAEIVHDVYPTSLGLTPGVMISANSILQILADRYSDNLPIAIQLVLLLVLAIGVIQMTYLLPTLWGTTGTLALMALYLWGGYQAVLNDIRADYFSVLFVGGGCWLIAVLYKYVLLLANSFNLYKQVATDPISGISTPRFFKLKLVEKWPTHKTLPENMALVIIQSAPLDELIQKYSYVAIEKQTRKTLDLLKHISPKKTWIGKLQENQMGVFIPSITAEELETWLSTFQKENQAATQLAIGVASAKQLRNPYLPALIEAAELALKRAATHNLNTVGHYNSEEDKLEFIPTDEKEAKQKKGSHLDYVATEIESKNQALERSLRELRKAHRQLEGHFLEVTRSLVAAMNTKDVYTAGHLERVARYSERLAQELELPKEEIENVRQAALLHDIGKMHLPDEILHKVGKLEPHEIDVIKQHLDMGAKILDPMKFFNRISTLLYHHHERYDGKGYPHGLTGEFIPPGSQIITIADSFDAMTTNRGYNKPKTVQEAITELRNGAGTQFNPDYVEVFCKILEKEGPRMGAENERKGLLDSAPEPDPKSDPE